jgi:hypothetical protein
MASATLGLVFAGATPSQGESDDLPMGCYEVLLRVHYAMPEREFNEVMTNRSPSAGADCFHITSVRGDGGNRVYSAESYRHLRDLRVEFDGGRLVRYTARIRDKIFWAWDDETCVLPITQPEVLLASTNARTVLSEFDSVMSTLGYRPSGQPYRELGMFTRFYEGTTSGKPATFTVLAFEITAGTSIIHIDPPRFQAYAKLDRKKRWMLVDADWLRRDIEEFRREAHRIVELVERQFGFRLVLGSATGGKGVSP